MYNINNNDEMNQFNPLLMNDRYESLNNNNNNKKEFTVINVYIYTYNYQNIDVSEK